MPKPFRQFKWIDYFALIFFCGLGTFIALGQHDWDWHYHRAVMEIDYRSWLLDLAAPTWSYQFCAGISRLADAEAFGLSPLFIIVLLFGSLWGVIFLVLFCAALGHYFLSKTLELIAEYWLPANSSFDVYSTARSLSLLVIGSNFFLWHFKVGHITFTLYYLCFASIYYVLQAILKGLTKRDFVVATLISWSFYSAGFYHALIFFLLPLALTTLISILSLCLNHDFRKTLKAKRSGILQALSSHFLGAFLGSYKILGILAYQREHPRVVKPVIETIDGLSSLFIEQFIPTLNQQYLLGINVQEPWGIWEYSSFSWLAWVLLGALIVDARNKFSATKSFIAPGNKLSLLLILFALLCFFGFRIGDTAWGPYKILNEFVLNHSVRVAGRFNFGFTLIIALVAWYYLLKSEAVQNMYRRCLPFILVLLLVNFTTFELSPKNFQAALSLQGHSTKEMRMLRMIPSKDMRLQTILDGLAVANCFSPLSRSQEVIPDILLPSHHVGDKVEAFEFSFLDLKNPKANEDCFVHSYFQQNTIILAPSCPADMCVNFNHLSPRDLPKYVFNEEKSRFCLKP